MSKHKLSTWQLVLISTGGMFGAGWLFSPYYGFQMAGVGVLVSWVISGLLSLIIGLSFIEIHSKLPIIGGVPRFVGITHNRSLAFVFMALSWLSYVVFLPLEAQSAIQYLGFWWHPLVNHVSRGVELSGLGLGLAVLIIFGLTWFNTFFVTNVAKFNSIISVGKLTIPIIVVVTLIFGFGKWENVVANYHAMPVSIEAILLAITTSGMAFAFTGFQNGLVLASYAKNHKRAVPYSVIAPIIFGGAIYFCLSLTFIACLPADKHLADTVVAPLLGLVAIFSAHFLFTILFIDAISAPLGTANVFTAVTGRVLYGLGRDFFPNSFLTRLNKYHAPQIALWISAIFGICFLLPFPTWKELVNFLSSIMVFSYLAGPIALILLRQALPEDGQMFKIGFYSPLGYLGFACCSLLVYWSGMYNLLYLALALILISMSYGTFVRGSSLFQAFASSWYLMVYMLLMALVSYLRSINSLSFPVDNAIIILIGLITCKIMLANSLPNEQIAQNMQHLKKEVDSFID
ncbi:MAG: family permease [Burkholderiales bacterium]|jgi:amino acid transporter|nr:family permease [Burkholderiales bacterium]